MAGEDEIRFTGEGGDSDPYYVATGWKARLIEAPIRIPPPKTAVQPPPEGHSAAPQRVHLVRAHRSMGIVRRVV